MRLSSFCERTHHAERTAKVRNGTWGSWSETEMKVYIITRPALGGRIKCCTQSVNPSRASDLDYTRKRKAAEFLI